MIILLPLSVLALFAVAAILVALLERRLSTARIVVGQMAMITSQGLPLGTGLALAARSERGQAARVLGRIGRWIAGGLPLDEALARGYPACPGLVRSVIEAGHRAGRLPATLRMLERDLVEQARLRTRLVPLGIPYALIVLVCALSIWSGVMIAIVPKYKEIFADFNATLPRLTVAMIEATDFCVYSGLAAVLFAALGPGVALATFCAFRPRRPARPRIASRIADRIRWRMPGFRAMERANGLGTVAAMMRLFTAAGMDLRHAARLAAETDVNLILRGRLRRFAQRLADGMPAPAAAHEAGLGDLFTSAMRTGQRAGQLDPALRYVAEYYGALSSRLQIVLRSLAWPTVTLCLAACIALSVLAMFMPLIALINATAGRM